MFADQFEPKYNRLHICLDGRYIQTTSKDNYQRSSLATVVKT